MENKSIEYGTVWKTSQSSMENKLVGTVKYGKKSIPATVTDSDIVGRILFDYLCIGIKIISCNMLLQ